MKPYFFSTINNQYPVAAWISRRDNESSTGSSADVFKKYVKGPILFFFKKRPMYLNGKVIFYLADQVMCFQVATVNTKKKK